MFDEGKLINGKYKVVGKVVRGMDEVEKIKKGREEENGEVKNKEKIIKEKIEDEKK